MVCGFIHSKETRYTERELYRLGVGIQPLVQFTYDEYLQQFLNVRPAPIAVRRNTTINRTSVQVIGLNVSIGGGQSSTPARSTDANMSRRLRKKGSGHSNDDTPNSTSSSPQPARIENRRHAVRPCFSIGQINNRRHSYYPSNPLNNAVSRDAMPFGLRGRRRSLPTKPTSIDLPTSHFDTTNTTIGKSMNFIIEKIQNENLDFGQI